jgi:hypothetical protein
MNLGAMAFHAFFNSLVRSTLSDPTTMYKVFRAECLHGLTFRCQRFDFDFELLGKLLRVGHAPIEVPVSYASRSFADGKKIRLLRDPPTWIAAIVRARFGSLHSAPAQPDATESSLVVATGKRSHIQPDQIV